MKVSVRNSLTVSEYLTKGPMSLPREVYAGPEGQLYCKPVEEVVAVFNYTVLESGAHFGLAAGSRVNFDVEGGSAKLLQVTVKIVKLKL